MWSAAIHEHYKLTDHLLDKDNVTFLYRQEKIKNVPRKVRETIYIKKESSLTLNRDGGANRRDFMILYK